MSVLELAWNWNATDEEWRTAYPCDRYIDGPHRIFMRAIDVDAPADVVFRWVCQLKVAPYSYDLLDNRGRRSPRRLTPGAEDLRLGQRLLIGPIVEFETGRHVTIVVDPGLEWVCGFMSLTYAVKPTGPASSRLLCKFDIECRTRPQFARLYAIAWGDLIMMRKQFLTLKALAEETARVDG